MLVETTRPAYEERVGANWQRAFPAQPDGRSHEPQGGSLAPHAGRTEMLLVLETGFKQLVPAEEGRTALITWSHAGH